METKHLLHTY